MSEPATPESTVPADAVASPTVVERSKGSNEVFLGGMVVAILCLLLLVLVGTFGFFGYRLWKSAQVERTIPSIQELGEKPLANLPTVPVAPPQGSPTANTPVPAVPVATTNPATLEIKVLNGGATKGSAGTLVDALKKAGYAKAVFGNTVADHTGIKIYYAAAAAAEAAKVKESMIKTYPTVTMAPAPAQNKDATAATVVVILGK